MATLDILSDQDEDCYDTDDERQRPLTILLMTTKIMAQSLLENQNFTNALLEPIFHSPESLDESHPKERGKPNKPTTEDFWVKL